MKSESDVLLEFADEIGERITRKTISALQSCTEILSGEDSELGNIWDEVCIQFQHEESFYWEMYNETVNTYVSGFVVDLKPHEKMALWFQTDNGSDWLYDDEVEREEQPPVNVNDIAEYITRNHVYSQAVNWSNERIRAYLESYGL